MYKNTLAAAIANGHAAHSVGVRRMRMLVLAKHLVKERAKGGREGRRIQSGVRRKAIGEHLYVSLDASDDHNSNIIELCRPGPEGSQILQTCID